MSTHPTATNRDPSPPVETTTLQERVYRTIYDADPEIPTFEVIALVRAEVAREIEALPENRSGYNGQRAVAWQMGYSHGRDDAAEIARGES